jgi:hypothetical protein
VVLKRKQRKRRKKQKKEGKRAVSARVGFEGDEQMTVQGGRKKKRWERWWLEDRQQALPVANLQ